MRQVDVVIIGAGAAGLFCAISAGQRGRKVLLIDHANKAGKKILMSGGGRCNFTNYFIEPDCFLSNNSHFCKSALARYTQWDFIALVEKYQVLYHEKKLGQLFCDNKSKDIQELLLKECEISNVEIHLKTSVENIKYNVNTKLENAKPERNNNKNTPQFILKTSKETVQCESLVIATGALSIPTMGATGFGYQVARQFGLNVLPTRAGLVPFTMPEKWLSDFSELSGTSIDAVVSCNEKSFRENILITHRGLSGPAILQISSYWNLGDEVTINLTPDLELVGWLLQKQRQKPNALLASVLCELFTKKLAQKLVELWFENKPLKQFTPTELQHIAEHLQSWKIKPHGTEGYRTAEVTLGGVDTDAISSKTMEAKSTPGLYFIGEVLDVTGHLGGFNFQWAWASGFVCGEVV